ncbi:serine/threonine protein kinase [Veronia nyctiphanis]|uniref:non-specific serine/threonine protein kinase n=1 Tax=Veronia nyctiphanis TaxID=1278244 RepID=A0A4Q0YXW0_9GAMM|nr:bifunctional protein-serine/threonine kinase/phosphatase [Veronia nyctiphanis]RXJ74039.1 serine/threonine protein kinase [Veronia nyctiphanis]
MIEGVMEKSVIQSTERQREAELASRLLTVSFGGCSDTGHRDENQDAFAATLPANLTERQHKGMVACIADGVSCSDNSQLASQTSVTHFIEDYLSTAKTLPVKETAGSVLNKLNQWLFHHAQQSTLKHNAMVTSFSSLVIKSNTAHLFHCGDCRVYLLRGGELRRLTRDHRCYTHNEKHYLTRGLGMDSHLEVDYQAHDVKAGDLLLLTTDGVHEALTTDQMTSQLSGLYANANDTGENPTLEHAAKQLVKAARQNGSTDNGTCLLVSVNNLPLAMFDEIAADKRTRRIPPVLEAGQKIDGYTIKRIIYSGSRSHLYLAKNTQDGRDYVLKMPSDNFADDFDYLQGFIREGWIGQQVSHPSILKVYSQPSSTPFLYHVCEWVEGVSLRQWIDDNPRADIATVRVIAAEMVVAIRALQRAGIYHRDIKPDNIMIRPDKTLTLIDFGSAYVSGYQELNNGADSSDPVGDLNYLAPECLTEPKPGIKSEMFSLGVTLYEVLTGELPYKRVTSQRLGRTVNSMEYIPAKSRRNDVPSWFNAALKKACHPDEQNRFQALSEFIAALQKPEHIEAGTEKAPLLERNPVLFWQGISGLLLILLLTQWFF